MVEWTRAAEARETVSTLRACLAALTPPSQSAGGDVGSKPGASVCTVGLMLSGCTVDDTMPGSPSFLCGQIKGGDVVEIVDGKSVTLDTLVEAIRGPDMPGSKMEMQLRGPDRTLKTVSLLRQPRQQVLQRRDLFLMLDEMRSNASAHVLEQRGKKKPDEPLIRFLNKSVEELTTTIRKISAFEGEAQDKERELREYSKRVSAVTHQYLGRLEHSLRDDEDEETSNAVKGEGEGKENNPQGSSQSARFLEMEKRAAEAEAALQVQQQAHAAVMLRMQAEVQSLQDQLAFARAVGEEPSATNADDVTLSGQLSRAKTKMAKLEAELAVAKNSLQAKNSAISEARLEAQAAIDAGKADREALKACRDALQQSQQELKKLERQAANARVGGVGAEASGASVGGNAIVATLEAQIAQLQEQVKAAGARAAAAEKTANQAKEEARILLRKRQADQSALAQVEADVMAVMSADLAGGSKGEEAGGAGDVAGGASAGPLVNAGNPQPPQSSHVSSVAAAAAERATAPEAVADISAAAAERDGEGAGGSGAGGEGAAAGRRQGDEDASENPNANAEKHKYEAAIIKIGEAACGLAKLRDFSLCVW